MKTNTFCPISEKKINENVARANAVITVIILMVFGLTHHIFLMVFLGIDFLLRASQLTKYSPIAFISKNIVKYLSTKPILVNAGPKIFAARIGLFFTGSIVITLLFFSSSVSLVIAGVLALFCFLEGAFGICVACIIYPYVYQLINQDRFK